MNEKIRKLLNDATCGLEPDLSPQRTITLNEMEKFAELIVRACAEVARLNTRVDSKVYLMIQEHFGVEE